MLWIEADRMGFLLEALDVAKLNAQRDIVKNERRQRVDNQPYGRVSEVLYRAMYPASHPYSWPVIGSMEDLSAASEEDVKSFFRRYYAPNNAFLTIVGDFDPEQARTWITRYFGDIPRGSRLRASERAAGDAAFEPAPGHGRSGAGAEVVHRVADGGLEKRRPLRAFGSRVNSCRAPDGASHESASSSKPRRQRRCRSVRTRARTWGISP